MRTLGSLVLLAAALAAVGCRKRDPIAHYKAPKEPTWRMVAAIVPSGEQTWFFKAVGPGRALAEKKQEFDRFLASVRFVDGKPEWTLPEGWREEKAGGERVATFKFGKADAPLELAVTKLEGAGGGVLANVNRWRGQLGLQPIEESDLSRETATRTIGGAKSTVVDFEGTSKPQAAPFAGGMSMPAGHPDVETNEPFTYDLPQGWTRSRSDGKRIEFQAGGARVSFTGMQGEAGGLAANVNRWRGQVGLEPMDDEAASRLAQPTVFLGMEANSVEIIATEKAILCVFRLDKDGSFFLKMDGPSEIVLKQRRLFGEFANSFRFKKNG